MGPSNSLGLISIGNQPEIQHESGIEAQSDQHNARNETACAPHGTFGIWHNG